MKTLIIEATKYEYCRYDNLDIHSKINLKSILRYVNSGEILVHSKINPNYIVKDTGIINYLCDNNITWIMD